MRSFQCERLLPAAVLAFLLSVGSSLAEVTHFDEPGMYPGRDYVHQSFAEHIDPFNGNLELQYVDVFVPGNGGFDLKVQRSYNSLRAGDAYSPFGRGWDIQFGRVQHAPGISTTCASSAAQSLSLQLPDGSQQTLYKSDGAAGTVNGSDYLTTQLWKAQCASGGITVFSPNGTRYDMTEVDNDYWLVKKMTDRNGNYADFSYVTVQPNGLPAPGRRVISSISTSDNRLINFTYSGNLLYQISAHGRTWSYSVTPASDGSPQLTHVQLPGTSEDWNYTYFGNMGASAGSYALQNVTNPQGGALSYTYSFTAFLPGVDPNRYWTVVKSKTSSDGTWSFNYSPSVGSYDMTTVTLPGSLGTITYYHFGHGAVANELVWKMGLLYQKVTGAEQTETYTWTSSSISSEQLARPGYTRIDSRIYRPLLDTRTITRGSSSYTSSYSNYDPYGNAQSISEAGPRSRQRTRTFFTNPSLWIIGTLKDDIVVGAKAITREYFSAGNLMHEAVDGVTTTFSYGADGTLASKTDARNFSTSYSSYYRGIPRSEIRPEGVVIGRSVDDLGNVTSESDGEFTWGYSYDSLNRITSVVPPTGSASTISWSATSRSLTRSSFNEITYFDPYGRTDHVTRSLISGTYKTFHNDALGRKTFESLPGSSLGTTLNYDMLGRVKNSTSPHGQRTYSYSGPNVTVTNERGKSTTYEYDRYGDPDEGFLTAIRSPVAAATIAMTRDAVGRLHSAVQDNVSRTYGYDAHNFLISLIEPETNQTTFGRDAVGNMSSKTVGGVTTTYTYDGLNRTKTAVYGGTAGTASFDYDRRGKLKTVSNPTATREYSYDQNGNRVQDKLTILNGGPVFIVGYAYDALDGLLSVTYPMGKGVVSYSPNALGRPTAASPYLSSVTHFDSGNLMGIAYANGVAMTLGEDSNWQLPNGITASSISLGLTYSYDNGGNVLSIADSYFPSENRGGGYDDIDRLTSLSGPWGSGTIGYFGSGNLDFQQFGSYRINYSYSGSANRLTSITGSRNMTFDYDLQGNIVSNGQTTFGFNTDSQLICAKCATSDAVTYEYDGQGIRVLEERGSRITYFMQAPNGDLQFEYTPLGMVWTKHVYLHGKRVASESDSDATPTTTVLAASPSPAQIGNAVTLTASVSPSTTGTVEFRDGALLLGTSTLSGTQATLTVPSLSEGSHSLTANYLGSANFQPSSGSYTLSVTDLRTATSIVLSATPASTTYGNPVTLAATISPGASGIVDFREGATSLGMATISGGQAVLVNSALSVGSHSIIANYQGDSGYKPSASAVVAVSVVKRTATVSISASPTSGAVGQQVTVSATVTGIAPTGQVQFYDGNASMGFAAVSNGVATWLTTPQSGSHSYSAGYSGDANHTSAISGAAVVTITGANATVSVSSSAPTSAPGAEVTFTANVTGSSSVGPTGTVTFRDGGLTVGVANISAGAATFKTTSLISGTHYITASYSGDANYQPVTSPSIAQEVTRPRSNVALASNGGIASASSIYGPGLPPSAAIDGERAGINWMNGSGWNDGTLGAFPDWLQVKFAGMNTIDRVVVYTLQDNYTAPIEPTDTLTFANYGIVDFTVEGWDGNTWVVLRSVTGNNLVKKTLDFPAFTTDRIRVNITSAGAAVYSHITELEAWGVSASNVALAAAGAVASASSNYGAQLPPSAAINGERAGVNWMNGSGWNDGTAGVYPDWLEVDFNGARTVDRVVVYTLQDAYNAPSEPTDTMTFSLYGITDFTVETWDGSSWVVAGTVSANNLVKRTINFASPVRTDRIRINISNGRGTYSHITEVEAYEVIESNVALAANGGIATASSEYGPGLPASAAINGERAGVNWNNGSGWNDATNGIYPDWLQVNFAGTRTVDRVVVYTLQDAYNAPSEPTDAMTFSLYGITDFTVEGWNGASWAVLGTVSGNNLVKRTVSFSPYATDRIRVNISNGRGVYSHITEVEAWGR